MKKITFTIISFLFANALFAQTFSTGTVTLRAGYTAKVDVSPTLVTLTQVGPSDRWFALAFNNNSMSSGDIIAFINTTNISDRILIGFGVPSADALQDWTTTSNTVAGSVRTVVSTRSLNTGESGDFVFSNTASSLGLGWSMSASASFGLASHGGSANGGQVATNLTLGNNEFAVDSFRMFPNPSNGITTIELPAYVTTGVLKIYDTLGRVVKTQTVSATDNAVSTSGLTTGTYIVVVRTDYGNATKNLLID